MKQFRGIWTDKSMQMKLYYLAIMVVAGLSIFSMLGSFLALGIFDVDFYDPETFLADPLPRKTIQALKLMHVFSVIGTFIIPAWLFTFTTGKDKLSQVFSYKGSPLLILLAALLFFALNPAIDVLQSWNQTWQLPEALEAVSNWLTQLEQNSFRIQNAFLQMDGASDFLVTILLMAVLPAIAEELLFRGILQPYFMKWFGNPHKAIWMTAFLFAAFHQQFHGILPLFLLGGLLGYLKFWSKSIWPAISAHFVNNTIAVIMVYTGHEMEQSIGLSLASILLGSGIIFLFSKRKGN